MGDTYCRVSGVDTLTTMASRTVDINANIVLFDIDLDIIICLWQNNYFGS